MVSWHRDVRIKSVGPPVGAKSLRVECPNFNLREQSLARSREATCRVNEQLDS